MRHLRFLLPLALMASVAAAAERHPVERNLFLSEHPRDAAPSIYVGGRVATVLHFEKPCDAARTRLLGWEGRFEPLLVGGRTVVLFPLQDLTPDDRLLLLVTLADGTELPFTVTAWKQRYHRREVDQQVNVFADRESYDAVLSALYAALQRERELTEQVERYQREDSIDHAFAALLAKGAVKMTPFRERQHWKQKDGDADVEVRLFSGKTKAAILFHLTNQDPSTPWRLKEARLLATSNGELRPFALRMDRTEIIPGASGYIAVIADRSAFELANGPENLVLEIFRGDGLRQALVLLDHRLARE